MNNNQRLNKKESNVDYRGLIIAALIFIVLIIGLIILIINIAGNSSTGGDDHTPNIVETQYDKLLKILNDKINETKVIDKESVNSITTFMYKNNKFHIAGYNDTYVYDLSLNVTTGVSDEIEAYNYIISDDTTSYELDYIDRLDISTSSSGFTDKYLTDGYTYKSVISSVGPITSVYMTRMDNASKDISLICGDDLDLTLSDSYVIKVINKEHQLHDIYQYLLSK